MQGWLGLGQRGDQSDQRLKQDIRSFLDGIQIMSGHQVGEAQMQRHEEMKQNKGSLQHHNCPVYIS